MAFTFDFIIGCSELNVRDLASTIAKIHRVFLSMAEVSVTFRMVLSIFSLGGEHDNTRSSQQFIPIHGCHSSQSTRLEPVTLTGATRCKTLFELARSFAFTAGHLHDWNYFILLMVSYCDHRKDRHLCFQ